jgi:hypothetical protein
MWVLRLGLVSDVAEMARADGSMRNRWESDLMRQESRKSWGWFGLPKQDAHSPLGMPATFNVELLNHDQILNDANLSISAPKCLPEYPPRPVSP